MISSYNHKGFLREAFVAFNIVVVTEAPPFHIYIPSKSPFDKGGLRSRSSDLGSLRMLLYSP